MGKFKWKKRIAALNIALAFVMVFSFIYVFFVGKDYPLHTRTMFEDGVLPKVEVTVDDPSVIRFERARLENNELVVDLHAQKPGETAVNVFYYLDGEKLAPEVYPMHVNAFRTIIDDFFGSFNGFFEVIIAILVLLLLIEAVMIWLFVDYVRAGDFCYPMIACGGLSIYLVFLLSYLIFYLFNDVYFSFSYFLSMVDDVGVFMLMVLAIPMLLLSLLLALCNLWLIRHEGFRLVNLLGVFFAVVWFLGAVGTIGGYFNTDLRMNMTYENISVLLVYIIGYMECLFLSTVACSSLATRYKCPLDRDFIIILGCMIQSDGSLTPLLKNRVDAAVAFEKMQFEKTGQRATFVPSGGKGKNESISEAEAMENYLLGIGVKPEQIAREDKSVNTFENMKLSKAVIDARAEKKDPKIAFSTTNYHVFRGYILSKKLGFEAKGISAKTKFYFFSNAFLREFIGLLVDQKWKHLVFILLTVGFFVLLRLF